jgi:glutathione S-transferase
VTEHHPYRLVSFKLCPYAQRSVIALEEKGAPYEIEYIELADKPAWFLELSPLGKVPILRVGQAVIFESAVISEYIEETAPGPQLHPADPLARAQNRAWIEVTAELLRRVYKIMSGKDEAATRKGVATARGTLARFEEELEERGQGPWFNGEAFSLVDAAVASGLQRLTWCEAIVPSLAIFADLPRVSAWRDALLARPSVQRSLVPEINEIFAGYLKGGGTPARKAEPFWLGLQG